jgi:cobalt/nickel transport system permease protein/cobalt/nickel transport protein
LLVAGFVVALLVAGVGSLYASHEPDGLTKVSQDQGFATSQKKHGAGDGPLAGYRTKGVDDIGLSRAVAGVVGSLVVLLIAGGGVLVVSRRRTADDEV